MYKDKDRQREAVREATRRYRERRGITKELLQFINIANRSLKVSQVITKVSPDSVIPEKVREKVDGGRPLVAHSPTCTCLMCRG